MRALIALSLAALVGCASGTAQLGNVRRVQGRVADGDWGGALALAEQVIASGPLDRRAQLEAYFQKALILEHYGRKREAAGLYEYLVHVAGESPGGARAKARLAELGGSSCPAK